MQAPASALCISLLAILLIALSYRVVRLRQKLGVGLGDGGQPELQQAMRVQANAAEYIPAAMLLLLAFEINGGAMWLAFLLGVVFVAGRAYHAWGFSRRKGPSRGRVYGTVLSWGVILALALANLALLAM